MAQSRQYQWRRCAELHAYANIPPVRWTIITGDLGYWSIN
jgi:hypothetical protein